ncbi:MAG: beta-phosphoglucomutase [Flavobacteriales bacterium]
MPIRGMLFDLDGVIVDTAKHHFIAWCEMADDLGISLREEDEENLKGVSRVDSLEWILNQGGLVLDSNTKLALMEQKNDRYLEHIGDMGVSDILPGAEEFIRKSKAMGIRVGLGSSSRNAPTILDAIGLTSLFDVIIDGNRITLSKPDPEVFILGAQSLGLSPSECLVIEDAKSGVEAGISGGFRVLGVGSASTLGDAHMVISNLLEANPEWIIQEIGTKSL